MSKLGVTPSQTVGPYFAIGLTWDDGPDVVPQETDGAFWIRGRVIDGNGDPIPDAVVETWQADPDGRFAHPDDPRGAVDWGAFRGLGRCGTDKEGRFGIYTVKPGRVPGPNGTLQAPHIDVTVMARGMLARLVTRIYFPEEEAANAEDPVLSSLPATAASETLMATKSDDGYSFDIHL
ncbi:MAG TPA: protocatechuate 3,4-dioxygenase subunit alpha, partial [Thermoleophilaceae bacterium]|nr:protocatechuate 3,4-dioxygenase subunit alpha [Thermoleophilaceae bacterium]